MTDNERKHAFVGDGPCYFCDILKQNAQSEYCFLEPKQAERPVPTTEEVKESYAMTGEGLDFKSAAQKRREDFDRWLNEQKHKAFMEGVEELKSQLLHVDYHPQSTGVYSPYAYRYWDGGFGMRGL
jgi:hypothetical protein